MICKKCGSTMQIESKKQDRERHPTLVVYVCPKFKNKLHKIDWNIKPLI